MPEGQFTGSRDSYVYTMDDGRAIILRLDSTLVLAGSGLTPYDPESPPANVTGKPYRFRPRAVYWQATGAGFEGRRKLLIVGTPGSTVWQSRVSQALTIDGVEGQTSGKRGESFSLT